MLALHETKPSSLWLSEGDAQKAGAADMKDAKRAEAEHVNAWIARLPVGPPPT